MLDSFFNMVSLITFKCDFTTHIYLGSVVNKK
jgi:hypothetical protein